MKPLSGQAVTLRALGEYLNLSATTISLVLNNAPGVHSIPQETRDRVIAAAEKFDYRPHFYARLLRNQQTCEKLRTASTAEAIYAILTDRGSSSQAA